MTSNSSCLCVCSAGRLCAYLIKQQPEGPFCLSSKLAQAVGPLACEQRDWRAAAVPAGACQGPGHQSLATSWGPVKQNAPARVANHHSGHSHFQDPRETECPCTRGKPPI